MKIHVGYEPVRHQKLFHEDLTSFLLHLSAGMGAGKTHSLIMKMFQLSAINHAYPGGLVCPDLKEFKKDVLPGIEDICDKNKIRFEHHKTENWLKFPWQTRGKVYVVSAEKKIRGPNWAYALINEVTLIDLVRYKEVIARVRIREAPIKQICSSGTPEGTASEYYDYFVENPPRGLRIIYGKTDDNLKNLDPNYISNLESSFDSKMLDAFRHGLWVNMSGNRFYYSYRPELNLDESIKPDPEAEYLCSMDFNVDPFCMTLWQTDGWSLYAVDQIELTGGEGYDTKKAAAALKSRGYHPHNTSIFPDPAGKARSTKGKPDLQILREAGFNKIFVRSRAPDMRRRQLNTNNLLEKGRVKINPKLAPGMRRDFEQVQVDPISMDKLKDNHKLTHFSDGFDYMCDILFPMSGAKSESRTVRIR